MRSWEVHRKLERRHRNIINISWLANLSNKQRCLAARCMITQSQKNFIGRHCRRQATKDRFVLKSKERLLCETLFERCSNLANRRSLSISTQINHSLILIHTLYVLYIIYIFHITYVLTYPYTYLYDICMAVWVCRCM